MFQGGIRAVIWTDFLQGAVMVGSCLLVVYKGTADVGGIGVVWERGIQGNRIELPEQVDFLGTIYKGFL